MTNFQHFKQTTNVPPAYQDVIARLVSERHRQKISQEQLASQIGCAVSLVHKWEQYKRVPSGFLLSCWLDALGLTIKIYKKKTEQPRRSSS